MKIYLIPKPPSMVSPRLGGGGEEEKYTRHHDQKYYY